MYQLTVSERILPGPRLDLLDPKLPEVSLLELPIAIGILPTLENATDGNSETVFTTTPKSLGMPQNGFVLCM